MSIDREIVKKSAGSLDSDVINLDNFDEVENACYVMAANLVRNAADMLDEYEKFFASYLTSKNGSVLSIMIEATNVDWACNHKVERLFARVVETIIDGIKYHRETTGNSGSESNTL